MGFADVFDYEAGKKDWGSYGLPRVGTITHETTAGDVARRDVPTCTLEDRLQAVRERVRAAGWDTCIVVNDRQVVLGRLGRRALRRDDDASVEDAMTEGPSTVRPSLGVSALLERMRPEGLTSFLITTPDGRLVGLVLRRDLENR
jgi:CBS domain-containing protein